MHDFPISLDPDFLMNENQAAELLGLSVRTLQNWRLRGDGPVYVKIGKAVRYKRRDVSEWLKANTIASTSQRPASAARG